MWRPVSHILAAGVVIGACGALTYAQAPGQTFRTSINLVPVDVRVVDSRGRPVTDLKATDFGIEENGIPQQIANFSTQAFVADAAAIVAEPIFRQPDEAAVKPRNRRVFLVMLGRGRHQSAFGYIDGLADFLRTRVLPQDQVAIFGWNRTTPFTSDRERLLRVLDRYRTAHEKIELDLTEWFSGLRAIFGSHEIPPFIQQQIDAVFSDADGGRPIAPTVVADAGAIERQTRRDIQDLQRSAEISALRDAGAMTLPDIAAENAASLTDLDFEGYAAKMLGAQQDLSNLYAGIGYLRHLDGEKHMIVLTERGISLPSQDSNVSLARVAADARIALDIVQTGGTVGAPAPVLTIGGVKMSPVASTNASFAQSFAIGDLRTMADLTGGQLQAFKKAADAFTRIADSTQFQYLLGYQPANTTLDGRFRRITVTVNRPGLRVMYRQGYFATSQLVRMDRREMITFTRMQAALMSGQQIDHLKIKIGRTRVARAAQGEELAVDVTVDLGRVKFVPDASGLESAQLDVELYTGDARQQVVSQVQRRIDLKYTPARRAEVARDGGPTVTITLPYRADMRILKIAAYDYGADVIGTASATISR